MVKFIFIMVNTFVADRMPAPAAWSWENHDILTDSLIHDHLESCLI